MRLIGYELKKLCGLKILWILLAICLGVNVFFGASAAQKSATKLLPSDQAAIIFDAYRADPEGTVADMEAYFAEEERLLQLQMEMIMNGLESDEELTFPEQEDVYSTDPDISDERLFSALQTAMKATVNYDKTLDEVIATANQNILRCKLMGNAESSFVYVVQLDTIARYTHLQDCVEPQLEYIRGWDGYFSYHRGNIILLFAVILICSMVFVYDREMRFFPLLRTTAKGRTGIAVSKLTAAMIAVCAVCLLITLSNLIVFGGICGFSSATNAIQAIPSLVLCPLKLSVWQGVLLVLGIQMLVFCAFAMVLLTCSLLFSSYAPVYLCGLGLYALNYLLRAFPYSSANVPTRYVNLISATNPMTCLERVYHLQMGGYMITFHPLLLAVCAILLVVFFVGGILLCYFNIHISQQSASRLKAWLSRLTERVRNRLLARRRSMRTYSLHIASAELRKRMSGRTLAALLLLLLGIYLMNDALLPVRSEDDKLYENYMHEWQGELTPEKLDDINAEGAFIQETLRLASVMEKKIREGEITIDEYMAYMEDYHYANSHEDAFERVKAQVEHLQKAEKRTGMTGELFYTTGWNIYFSQGVSPVLIAVMLLLFTGSFSDEYVSHASAGAFVSVLRTTKHGRQKTHLAKLGVCALLASLLSLVYSIIELCILGANWSLPGLHATLFSIPMFEASDGGMSVISMIALTVVMRIVLAAALGVLVACLSGLIKRSIAVLSACFALVFFPTVLIGFGVSVPTTLTTMDYLSVVPHLLTGMQRNLLGSDFLLPILLWGMVALLLVAAAFASRRVYVGRRYGDRAWSRK